MKTFEERYTAWIDGRLEGSALTAFEQELTRRAAAGEAQADRQDTQRLRALLRALPGHAALLLVGDVDQLPSVGPARCWPT